MKLKTCSVCNKECFLWKAKPKMCKDCSLKAKGFSIIPVVGGVYKITSISPSNTKPISKVSDKQKVALKAYSTLRKVYLENHPSCEAKINGCSKDATTIHHKKGRIGALLTDIKNFLPCCIECHNYIEQNPIFAKAKGFSLNRLDV